MSIVTTQLIQQDISVRRRTVLKYILLVLNMSQIFNDFVVSKIFWANACTL